SFTAHNELKLPSGCKNPRANDYVQVRSVSFSLSSGRIDISTELEVNASVYENIDVACVSSITPDDTKPKRADSTPAIVLYFADAGEDLWSIARDHNTSVEKIREENELDEDTITEPKLLLVTV
ncbi:MAG: LysM peptidoglycan-binding domain-containing protein, partial [Clostridia bacterium]|nr:LysM peptidoglycan-binding domain-containing protein [Clostridia bacterium]